MDVTKERKLDRLDVKILEALSNDARLSWTDLADKIGLSLTPVMRRVRQLEASGVIRGYTIVIEDSKLIGTMPLMILVRMEKRTDAVLHGFETAVSKFKEIVGGSLISGVHDYILQAYVRDLDHYRELLTRLSDIDGIANIQSSFMLNVFMRRNNPLADA